MNVELDVEEFVSRCVAIMACYSHLARTWKDWASIVVRIQALSEEFDLLEVSFESIRPLILVQLSDQIDRETANRLSREFTDLLAFIYAPSQATVGHG